MQYAPTTGKQSMHYVLASIVIVAILGIQTWVIAFNTYGRYWPFINYPMYSGIHREGDRLDVYYPVFATFEDASEKQILPSDLEINVFTFQKVFVAAILCAVHGDKPGVYAKRKCKEGELSRVKDLLKSYEGRAGQRIVRLRVADYPLILSRGRPKEVPAETLEVLDLG